MASYRDEERDTLLSATHTHTHTHNHGDEERGNNNIDDTADDAEARLYEYDSKAYAIIVLWGFALLLPWNVMLNAIPFFQQEYPTDGSIAFHLTAAYVYPQLPLLFLMVYFGNRISIRTRILGCLLIQAAAVVLIPVLVPVKSVWTSLAMMFVVGLTTAVLQSSMFGFTSNLPPAFSQGLMSGQGIAGISAGVLAIIIDATIPNDETTAAIVYFTIAAATLVLAAGSYLLMVRLPFTQYHMRKSGMLADGARTPERTAGSLNDDEPLIERKESSPAQQVSTVKVVRKVGVEAISVFMVFFVTFLIFPGVVPSQLKFKGTLGKLHMSNSWWTLILLLIFNIFDTVGRTLPAWVTACRGYILLVGTFVRFVTVPLFYGAVHNWTAGMEDVFVAFVMAGFAVTNGYLASMAMITGPMKTDPAERERAGFLMSFFLQAGILVGSQAAFGFTGGP